MHKFIYILLVGIFINGCTYVNNFNEKVELVSKGEKRSTFDSCASFSYISKVNDEEYGEIFSEYINLDHSCSWTGLARGYFEYLFKTTLKLESFKIVQRVDFKNYEFTTYLIDNKYYMNLIYKYSTYEDLFIIDYDGKYFTKLIKDFDPSYQNLYLNEKRFLSNYSNSLVKMNFINSYFSRQRESIFEK